MDILTAHVMETFTDALLDVTCGIIYGSNESDEGTGVFWLNIQRSRGPDEFI